MNRKMIDEAIHIRISDPELERQIRCFPYEERSDVPRLQQVERQSTLTLVVKCEHFHCCFLYQCFGECHIFAGLDYEL
jgi:hypothetical protein